MGRLFDNAGPDIIKFTGIPSIATTSGLTVACWITFDTDTGAAQRGPDLRKSDDTFICQFQYQTGNARIQASINLSGATYQVFTANSSISTNGTLYHIALTHDGSNTITNYDLWLDGVVATDSRSGSTSNSVTTGVERVALGDRYTSTVSPLDGNIYEAAIWDAQLTAGEIAAIGTHGFSPLLVRPGSLAFYAPLVRGLQDKMSSITGTATGTTVSDHIAVYNPSATLRPSAASAVGAANIPEFMHHYQQQLQAG